MGESNFGTIILNKYRGVSRIVRRTREDAENRHHVERRLRRVQQLPHSEADSSTNSQNKKNIQKTDIMEIIQINLNNSRHTTQSLAGYMRSEWIHITLIQDFNQNKLTR